MFRVLPIFYIGFCLLLEIINVGSSQRQIQQWSENNKTGPNPQPSVRGMLNLYSMIECATNCNPWNLNNYGNYCGFGGSGIPINDIDRCCEQHDSCYDDNQQFYECYSSMYVSSYDWSCNNGYPQCHDGYDKCALWTCVCDKAFMECLNDAGCP